MERKRTNNRVERTCVQRKLAQKRSVNNSNVPELLPSSTKPHPFGSL